jgi:murein DD-endopeptidase MepM/ murein hydrolase activator NlpD
MPRFPLPVVPAQQFADGALSFGNDRGKVDHAACDLIAAAGTPVLAIEDGVVWYGPVKFFESRPDAAGNTMWTYELTVIHSFYIARYGEISPNVPSGIHSGVAVQEGQQIASVGDQVGSTMLHFELFRNTNSREPLTRRGNKTYLYVSELGKGRFNRREDLLDPTMILLPLAWGVV